MESDKDISEVAKREEEILDFWNTNEIFRKTQEKDAPRGEYVFYDGPPFATGLPHHGHILAGTIKDAIPRYRTMRGYRVPRRWGWDCHGLPLENEIEAELGLKNKRDIEALGIEKFNKMARDRVLRYADDWKRIIPRMGRFVDMENDYKTMDTTYTESIWWAFKTLYEKSLIYEGFKSMHLCPRCETTLSNFEVAQGYKDITDFALTVKFKLADALDTYLLAWTTTAWTLPGNAAVAVNKDARYVKVLLDGEHLILAKDRLGILEGGYKIEEEFDGAALVGKTYTPVFDYYLNAEFPNKENAWKVYHAPYVSTEDGTGIVHLAPAFGAEDMDLAKEEGIPLIHHVATNGEFVLEVTDFAGEPVKPKDDHQRTDIKIIQYLAHKGLLFKKEKVLHAYPHCWRCDTPLLNYAASSWFVKVADLKKDIIKQNQSVAWVPAEMRDGRFGKMLESAPDWAISRARYWGAPLPVWKCGTAECSAISVIGSLAELQEQSSLEVPQDIDLHRPYIDEHVLACSCGGQMHRIPDVFDCWFESGSMPFGQHHYPFEHKDRFDPEKGKGYPADFIAEGLDQTRGWFYSLIVLGTALFGQTPFKNVIVNGLVLAEDGRKMSKRLKNYPEPMEVVNRYGADALRYYLLSSPIMRSEDLNFSEKGVDEVMKKIVLRLGNVLAFYELYARTGLPEDTESSHPLDVWIRSRLAELVSEVTEGMEKYELDRATRPIMGFVDDLSTWYLRRSRDRFKGSDEEDKQHALRTTQTVLVELSKVLAPFMPFFAEHLYRRTAGDEIESVHLADWPDQQKVNTSALEEMARVREVVSQALEARSALGIRVRQPLSLLTVKHLEVAESLLPLIAEEVNVHHVVADSSLTEEVLLDPVITPELKAEGEAREFIRQVQELRKKEGLSPEDTVSLVVETDATGKTLIETFKEKIQRAAHLSEIRYEASSGEEIGLESARFRVTIKR